MASGSCWQRFPPITRFAATRDRYHPHEPSRHEPHAADAGILDIWQSCIAMQGAGRSCLAQKRETATQRLTGPHRRW